MMWPWGHLAVGYLLYSASRRVAIDRSPTDSAALAVAVGTQFPDVIDKPLAWTFGVLPNGRSLAHSLITTAILVAVLGWLLQGSRRRELAIPFGVGYLSHLLADGLPAALAGDLYNLGFLAWPLVPAIVYETEPSFLAHFQSLELTTSVLVQFLLVGVATLVWIRDGKPGLEPLRALSSAFARSLRVGR